MKNIRHYETDKYNSDKYEKIDEYIYKTVDDFMGGYQYVTSLCFEQEPEFDEGTSPQDISQYPLEDILDKYLVAIEDFYESENNASTSVCFLEFTGSKPEYVKNLLEIVGKHVYNKEVESDGEIYVELVIE